MILLLFSVVFELRGKCESGMVSACLFVQRLFFYFIEVECKHIYLGRMFTWDFQTLYEESLHQVLLARTYFGDFDLVLKSQQLLYIKKAILETFFSL